MGNVNIERLRRNLKRKWLIYYQANRPWLVQLGVWVSCDGQRRPSSSFILATLTVLEPQLTDLLPLVVDLSPDPDDVVRALGLNFDPEQVLENRQAQISATQSQNQSKKMLPSHATPEALFTAVGPAMTPNVSPDECCRGTRGSIPEREAGLRSPHRSD